MRPSILAALVLALAPLHAARADEATVVVEPLRRYGYVIGDEIELRAAIAVPPGYALAVESLPKPGRANTFLELRAIERQDGILGRLGRAATQRVSLRFAVVNSGADVATAQTSAVTLRFQREGAPELVAVVPQVNFTVSPLTPAYVAGVAGLEEMQPDVAAPADLGAHAVRSGCFCMGSVRYVLAAISHGGKDGCRDECSATGAFACAVAEIRRQRADGARRGAGGARAAAAPCVRRVCGLRSRRPQPGAVFRGTTMVVGADGGDSRVLRRLRAVLLCRRRGGAHGAGSPAATRASARRPRAEEGRSPMSTGLALAHPLVLLAAPLACCPGCRARAPLPRFSYLRCCRVTARRPRSGSRCVRSPASRSSPRSSGSPAPTADRRPRRASARARRS